MTEIGRTSRLAKLNRAAARKRAAASCCLLVLAVGGMPVRASAAAPQVPAQVRIVETRPGVTVRVALALPGGPPAGVLVMFPGGNGAGHFRPSGGTVILGGNFLVRTTPQYVARGWAVAIVDVPSDHARGMPDEFRTSSQHAQDTQKVVQDLAGLSLQPIYLVGTSLGTLSVAYLGTVLADERIKGIALTSTMRSAGALPLNRVKVPVLVVHHHDDACRATPLGAAERLPSLLSGSPKATLVVVHGGSPPRSDPCEPLSAHGFLGVETVVVDIIVRWAAGDPVPSSVGP